MKYLYLKEIISETDVIVRGIHSKPFDEVDGYGKTEEELNEDGYLVEIIPQPNPLLGTRSVLHINPINNETWYTYEAIELPRELEIEQLKSQQALMQQAIDDLIFGGTL